MGASVRGGAFHDRPKRYPFALAREPNAPAELTVISFPGEEALTAASTAPAAEEKGAYREHLLVSSSVSTLFRKGTLVTPSRQKALPQSGERPLLTKEFEELLGKEHPPRPLEIIVRGDPASGVRGYAFTIHESLRLLAQQQRSSDQSDLALVLPGGGVKAAYQSKIVDHLYKGNLLRNADLGEKNGTLLVNSVLGTSGGALLGYFVAQLGEHGPFNLSEILWSPERRTLQATDVFAATDMLRYVSIAWTLLVFCVVLALITGRYRSAFYGRSVTPHGSWRWRLMTLLAVFFAVPILIRFVTGGDDIEHVPVIEGIFYSLLTVMVMFCDQCLVYSRDQDHLTRSLGLHVILLAGLGGLFVFASFFGVVAGALQEPVAIGFAFATLSVIFLGSPLLLLYATGRFGDLRRRVTDVLVSLVAVLILCAFGFPGRLPPQVPHLLALLVLIVLAVFAYVYAQKPERKPWVATLLTFLTLFSTAVLCWPPAEKARPLSWRPSWTFVSYDAMKPPASLRSWPHRLLLRSLRRWCGLPRREYSLRDGEDFSFGWGCCSPTASSRR